MKKTVYTFMMMASLLGCANNNALSEERDMSAGWTMHSRTIGNKVVSFGLPPGGTLNPPPGVDVFKFGDGAFGAVSYGQRAQGRELASLRISLELRRYPTDINAGLWTSAKLGSWADSSLQQSRLVESKKIKHSGLDWHYQLLEEKSSNLIWRIRYLSPFDETRYIEAYAMLWPTFAKSRQNIEFASATVERLMKSVEIKNVAKIGAD
jgi:hypothetical protein